MRTKETIKLVAGSIAVYVAVACSSGLSNGFGTFAGDDASTSSGIGADGASGSTGTSMMDALTGPVAIAKAGGNESGSRLKPEYLAGSDGSRTYVPYVMRDSQLGVDCTFGPAADGSSRCLPVGASTQSFYADSGCSRMLAYASGCDGPAPGYALQLNGSTCPGSRVFAISGPFTGTVYLGSPAQCAPAGSFADGDTFYTMGAELPPTSFVHGSMQIDP